MADRKFDDFDQFAMDYRAIHSDNIKLSGADSFYFAKMKVELLTEFENDDSSIQVLDFGCGDGATEVFINKFFPQWTTTGIDISEESIKSAKNKKIFNAEFLLFDGFNIPLPDHSIDIVFIAGVLHHVSFGLHADLLKEIFRVLKQKGRLYLFEHNPINPLTKYLVKTCVFDKDAKLLPNNYTTQLLRSTGFAIDKKSFIIFFPRKGLLSKLIFLEKYFSWLPLGGQYFIKASKKS